MPRIPSTAAALRTLAASALAIVSLAACSSAVAPRNVVYRVTGTLTADTCGVQNGQSLRYLSYATQFNIANGLVSWQLEGSRAPTYGVYNTTTRSFTLQVESEINVSGANVATGTAACVILRNDSLTGQLSAALPRLADGGLVLPTAPTVADASMDAAATADAGASDDGGASATDYPTFEAVETIVYGAETGASCSVAIGAADGQYNALPCQQTYTLHAVAEPSTN